MFAPSRKKPIFGDAFTEIGSPNYRLVSLVIEALARDSVWASRADVSEICRDGNFGGLNHPRHVVASIAARVADCYLEYGPPPPWTTSKRTRIRNNLPVRYKFGLKGPGDLSVAEGLAAYRAALRLERLVNENNL